MLSISTFNWANLNRKDLFKIINSLRSKIVDKSLSPHQLHEIFSTHLKAHLPIRVSKKYDPIVSKGEIWIGGMYYSDLDQEYRRAIEISFNYNPTKLKLTVNSYRWKRMCMLFADTVLHEVIHMRQYRIRNFKEILEYPSTAECAKQRASQSYYGCRDEIDAYGFNLACELYDRFGTNYNQAINYLEHGSHKRNKKSVYYEYLKAFDFDTNHKVIKRLKKRAMRYFPCAQIGKPFKSSDWLYS